MEPIESRMEISDNIIDEYILHLSAKDFPCIGAKASIQKDQSKFMVADHIGCPKDDREILKFLYDFIDEYRNTTEGYYSASILFKQPTTLTEEEFDSYLWTRLQSLADMDSVNYSHDKHVSDDPGSPDFCYSLKEEAFFIIGMHAGSSRASRHFKYPVLIFNPHAQFQKLRQTKAYSTMQNVIRAKDILYSGSVNPMLMDFAKGLEVNQYSGRNYDDSWKCPLKINHAELKHNTST